MNFSLFSANKKLTQVKKRAGKTIKIFIFFKRLYNGYSVLVKLSPCNKQVFKNLAHKWL